jgi:hypothetical protein
MPVALGGSGSTPSLPRRGLVGLYAGGGLWGAVVIGVARVVFGRVWVGQRRVWCRGRGRGVCRIGARARSGSVAVRSGAEGRRHDGSRFQPSIGVCRCPDDPMATRLPVRTVRNCTLTLFTARRSRGDR